MAKEFKHFDTMFSRAEINACRDKYFDDVKLADRAKASAHIKRWDRKTDYWTNDEIREAVYMMEDSVNWQLFRVSLKGLTTQEKLYMLAQYYVHHDAETTAREKLRIDNYIGALRRGGQLGMYNEVLK